MVWGVKYVLMLILTFILIFHPQEQKKLHVYKMKYWNIVRKQIDKHGNDAS